MQIIIYDNPQQVAESAAQWVKELIKTIYGERP